MHTAEPLTPKSSSAEVKNAPENWKDINQQVLMIF